MSLEKLMTMYVEVDFLIDLWEFGSLFIFWGYQFPVYFSGLSVSCYDRTCIHFGKIGYNNLLNLWMSSRKCREVTLCFPESIWSFSIISNLFLSLPTYNFAEFAKTLSLPSTTRVLSMQTAWIRTRCWDWPTLSEQVERKFQHHLHNPGLETNFYKA